MMNNNKGISTLFSMMVIVLSMTACSNAPPENKAVYMLMDTSGTYTQQLDKAQTIVNYLLASLDSGDSLAIARIDSASFSERDIIAKVTFDSRPSVLNSQKRQFKQKIDNYIAAVKPSSYTDISGGLLQAVDYLNETQASHQRILIFSDLKEELKAGHKRDFVIPLSGVEVLALNVTKLKSDNIDPLQYKARLNHWENKVNKGGGVWRVVNDLERLDALVNI